MNVLVLSPGHPVLSAGGAETAAYALFQQLKLSQQFSQVMFVARAAPAHLMERDDPGVRRFRGRADEWLIDLPSHDHFSFTSHDQHGLRERILGLLTTLRPHVVHVHHFHQFGIEILEIIRAFGARIVFTAHEMLAICHHHGQMMKVSGQLCHESSPLECNQCFPKIHPDAFFLRKQLIAGFLEAVDVVISPSRFLTDRLERWGGLAGKRLETIENPLSPEVLAFEPAAGAAADHGREVSIGYFGRLTPFKGVVPFLRSLAMLGDDDRRSLRISLHGGYEGQSRSFIDEVEELIAASSDCVTLQGPYAFGDTCRLMADHDWIVVPSVWWENSPVVIQEALSLGKPVLCSRLGGMAEKVEEGVSGWQFTAGSPVSMSRLMARIVRDKQSWPTPDREASRRVTSDATARIMEIYRELY